MNPSKVQYNCHKYILGHLLHLSSLLFSPPLVSPRLRAAVCWEEVFIKTTQCLHPLRCTDGFCWTLSFNTWGKSQDAASLQTFDEVKEVLNASRVYKAGFNSSSSPLWVSAEAICNQQCVPAIIQWSKDRTAEGVLEKTIWTLCSHWFLNLKYFL